MTPIKPLDGGKHTGRSARDLTSFQWFAAALLTGGKYPEGATLPNGKKVRGIPSDDVVDVAASSEAFAGIIEYPGDEIGRPTTIITAGRIKIKSSGSGKAGDSIKVIAGGKGAKASAGELAIGKALEDWVDGQIVAFLTEKHVVVDGSAGGTSPSEGEDITSDSPIALRFGEASPAYALDPLYSAVFSFMAPAEGRVDISASSTSQVDVLFYQNGQVISSLSTAGGDTVTNFQARPGEILARASAGVSRVTDLVLTPQFLVYPAVKPLASGDTVQQVFEAGGMRRYGVATGSPSQWGKGILFFYNTTENAISFDSLRNSQQNQYNYPYVTTSAADAAGNVWALKSYNVGEGDYTAIVTNTSGQDINPFLLKVVTTSAYPRFEGRLNVTDSTMSYLLPNLARGQAVQTIIDGQQANQKIKLEFSGGMPLVAAGQKSIHAKFIDAAGQLRLDADTAPGESLNFDITAGGDGVLYLTPVGEGVLGVVVKASLA